MIPNKYKTEALYLLKHLRDNGAKIIGVQEDSTDGGTYQAIGPENDDKIIEHLFSCDDGLLWVSIQGAPSRWIRIIVGNDWGELVNDYNAHPDLDKIMNTWEVES